jgi:uncharacterized protein (DUF2267 family)
MKQINSATTALHSLILASAACTSMMSRFAGAKEGPVVQVAMRAVWKTLADKLTTHAADLVAAEPALDQSELVSGCQFTLAAARRFLKSYPWPGDHRPDDPRDPANVLASICDDWLDGDGKISGSQPLASAT